MSMVGLDLSSSDFLDWFNSIWNQEVQEAQLSSTLETNSARDHQFLIMIKPEFFEPNQGRQLEQRFHFLAERFHAFGVKIVQAKWIRGARARETRLIEQLYPILWSYSDDSGRSREQLGEEIQVMGGHEFLRRFPDWDSDRVLELWKKNPPRKLGSGAYIVACPEIGKEAYLLNGFFPSQLHAFSNDQAQLMGLECLSTRSWDEVRNHFVGSIQPAGADQNSLRYLFWKHSMELGLENIHLDRNLFHVSPGPIEAYYQLRSFFGEEASVEKRSPLNLDAFPVEIPFPIPQKWIEIFNRTENCDHDAPQVKQIQESLFSHS